MVRILPVHFIGVRAPGLRDIRATARSMHFVLLAHGRAIERLRGCDWTIWESCLNQNGSNQLMQRRKARGRSPLPTASIMTGFLEAFDGAYRDCSGARPAYAGRLAGRVGGHQRTH